MNLLKSVFISESNNIFLNLALEDWLYQNCDFLNRQVLMLWRNKKCVVIGRHQNPWLETNLIQPDGTELTVARRNSGGGTVYHDMENLNLSFFTSRETYNRLHNLELIVSCLRNEWNIDCNINEREDILLRDCKISGTASKLGRRNAYHHCTLLVDADRALMSKALKKEKKQIFTNATKSVPAPVLNIREAVSTVTVERLVTTLGLKYLETSNSKQDKNTVKSNGFFVINPEEQYFPGLNERVSSLKSWEWRFGRTPKFKVLTSVLINSLVNRVDEPLGDNNDSIDIMILVVNGVIKNVEINVPVQFHIFTTENMLEKIGEPFKNVRYSETMLTSVRTAVQAYFKDRLQDERLAAALL